MNNHEKFTSGRFVLPKDWVIGKLADYGESFGGLSGKSKENFGRGRPYIPYMNIFENIVIDDAQFDRVTIGKNERQSMVIGGDILFTTSSETPEEVGMCSIYAGAAPELYLNSFSFGYRLKAESPLVADYIPWFMRSSIGRRMFFRLAQGATRYNLSKKALLNEPIWFPPKAEQEAISMLLLTIERSIQKNQRLIKQKIVQRTYLLQSLLTGKRRLDDFDSNWRTFSFRDLATESRIRNSGQLSVDRLMAVSKVDGIVPMRERVQGVSADRCKLIEKDFFAYNPMRLNIGSIARWTEDTPAMVSGDYVVFKCDEAIVNPAFLDLYRQSSAWSNYVKRAGDGSVRVRIYFSHLEPQKLKLPPVDEQKVITRILGMADWEITLLKTKSQLLKLEKKWLMQVLLTGKKRVTAINIDESTHQGG